LIFNQKSGAFLTSTSAIAGIVAGVAFETGGSGKIDGVTISAGCPLVADAAAITAAAGMRQVE
jgi:hypothetical protein